MKKLFIALTLSLGVAGASHASNFKLDQTAVDAAFAVAEDVSFLGVDNNIFSSAVTPPEGEITKTGFLLRSFFCGFIGLHRSYMGTGGKTLWFYYLCIPIGGSVVNCVDFWGTVIKGDEFMNKYKDNPKWIVWGK